MNAYTMLKLAEEQSEEVDKGGKIFRMPEWNKFSKCYETNGEEIKWWPVSNCSVESLGNLYSHSYQKLQKGEELRESSSETSENLSSKKSHISSSSSEI